MSQSYFHWKRLTDSAPYQYQEIDYQASQSYFHWKRLTDKDTLTDLRSTITSQSYFHWKRLTDNAGRKPRLSRNRVAILLSLEAAHHFYGL